MCQFHDVDQTDVSFAALYPAHVVPVYIRQLSELFLRELALQPKLAKTPAEYDSGVEVWHSAILGT